MSISVSGKGHTINIVQFDQGSGAYRPVANVSLGASTSQASNAFTGPGETSLGPVALRAANQPAPSFEASVATQKARC
jgi:hypothetical protein